MTWGMPGYFFDFMVTYPKEGWKNQPQDLRRTGALGKADDACRAKAGNEVWHGFQSCRAGLVPGQTRVSEPLTPRFTKFGGGQARLGCAVTEQTIASPEQIILHILELQYVDLCFIM